MALRATPLRRDPPLRAVGGAKVPRSARPPRSAARTVARRRQRRAAASAAGSAEAAAPPAEAEPPSATRPLLALGGAAAFNCILGSLYLWSVYLVGLQQELGASRAALSAVFSLATTAFTTGARGARTTQRRERELATWATPWAPHASWRAAVRVRSPGSLRWAGRKLHHGPVASTPWQRTFQGFRSSGRGHCRWDKHAQAYPRSRHSPKLCACFAGAGGAL